MGTKVRIEVDLDVGGLFALMNSDGISGECRKSAERIAAAAGDGFNVTRAYYPGTRVMYRVYGDSDDANIAEADEKVLSRAVSACRS